MGKGKELEVSDVMSIEQDEITAQMRSLFQMLPKELACEGEADVKRYFCLYMMLAKADVDFMPSLATGNPDAVLKTNKAIYVFEIMYNQSAEKALARLREKHYAAAFASDGRRVYYVGVNYNPAADVRTIDDVKCECVQG